MPWILAWINYYKSVSKNKVRKGKLQNKTQRSKTRRPMPDIYGFTHMCYSGTIQGMKNSGMTIEDGDFLVREGRMGMEKENKESELCLLVLCTTFSMSEIFCNTGALKGKYSYAGLKPLIKF
jgi:hypothetical protein